jgi:hypothetical protein
MPNLLKAGFFDRAPDDPDCGKRGGLHGGRTQEGAAVRSDRARQHRPAMRPAGRPAAAGSAHDPLRPRHVRGVGCQAFVLGLEGTEAHIPGNGPAELFAVLPTVTNGWRDISLNGRRLVFREGRYVPEKAGPPARRGRSRYAVGGSVPPVSIAM